MTLLEEIFAHKRTEVAQSRKAVPLSTLEAAVAGARPALEFVAALRPRLHEDKIQPALIAEIKCASPSRGLLVTDFDPLRLARIYRENGAAAISVLTDQRYFGGHLGHLRLIAQQNTGLPLLRKDFVCDPYQLYEARSAGADAVLLIAAALPDTLLHELHELAGRLGMAALIEVHTDGELERALACHPALVGINNRDLRSFTVDLGTTEQLCPRIPAGITVVAESGIQTAADVARLAAIERLSGGRGVDAILVGEALVTAPDIAARVRSLAGRAQAIPSGMPDGQT